MTIKVFLSGQSNALGRYAGTRPWSQVSSDVRVWNSTNPGEGNGTAFVTAEAARAAGTFMDPDKNNFAVWFCDALARNSYKPVDLTVVARGASPIALWSPDETVDPMLQRCIDVWTATGQGPADVFLWHQGEGDCLSLDYPYWINAFNDLVANLKVGGVISDSTVILAGGLTSTRWEKVDFNWRAIGPAMYARKRAFVPSEGLSSDGTHFHGDALEEFGARRYYAAHKLASV